MRRGTIVAGLTAGVLGVAGVATASAADAPILIVFTQGTTTFGTLATGTSASPSSTGAASFSGTIATSGANALTATFPASDIKLPQITIPDVAFGGVYGTGKLVVDSTPFAFTGKPSATLFSLDLTGTIAYKFTATTSLGTYSCNSEAPIPVTFNGTAIDPATGAYGAAGSQTNLLLRASTPSDLAAGAFCTSLVTKLPVGAQIASKFSGNLAIPGLLPVAPAATPVVTTPTTPTTPSSPVTPTPVVKPGKLAVSISKPKTVKRGSSTVTKVVLRNTGTGTARSVTVKLTAGKGVTPRTTTKTYSSIAAGKSRTINVRLRTTKSTAKSSAVKVTATGASGLSASKSTTLRLR